jgi:hypothetical protein
MMSTSMVGWGRALFRAALQLAMAVMGHYDPRIASLFAVMGMFLSLVAGFLFGRWSGGALGRGGAAAGGLVAGAACALIGILESFYLGDVPAWVVAFGTVSSAVTGATGGFLGKLTVERRTENAERRA